MSGYATDSNSQAAQHGQDITANQPIGPFTPSVGLHPNVHRCASIFGDNVNMHGGVRQGAAHSSAPDTGRPGVIDPSTYKAGLEMQTQGSGDTFRERQERRTR